MTRLSTIITNLPALIESKVPAVIKQNLPVVVKKNPTYNYAGKKQTYSYSYFGNYTKEDIWRYYLFGSRVVALIYGNMVIYVSVKADYYSWKNRHPYTKQPTPMGPGHYIGAVLKHIVMSGICYAVAPVIPVLLGITDLSYLIYSDKENSCNSCSSCNSCNRSGYQ